MATFNADFIFEALPSFYRERLTESDRAVLSKFWEGLVRLVDADYGRLFDVAAAPKLARAAAFSRRPWYYRTLAATDWEYRDVAHQHVVVRAVGAVSGVFYLGRRLALDALQIRWAGLPVELTGPSFVTNDPDPDQLRGARPLGTRLELRRLSAGVVVADDSWGDETQALTVESGRELCWEQLEGDGVVSTLSFRRRDDGGQLQPAPCIPHAAKITLRRRRHAALQLSYVDGDTYASAAEPFQVGQLLEVRRADGTRQREVVAEARITTDGRYRFATPLTDLGTNGVEELAQVLDWTWAPPTVTATTVVFATPVPAGVRLRITDPSGVQTVDSGPRPRATIVLPRRVEPTHTAVYLYNVDLTAITVAADGVDFGRPPASGTVWEVEAPFDLAHDHARFSTVAPQDLDYFELDPTRPLALTALLTEDSRYPVHVYLDGVLQPRSAYSFLSTIRIAPTSGVYARGTRLDVVYVDAEDPAPHRHFRTQTVAATGEALSAVALETAPGGRYPPLVETAVGGLTAAASLAVADDRLRIEPAITGPEFVRVDVAYPALAWRTLLPAAAVAAEARTEQIVSAAALQDGIDVPAVALDAASFTLTTTERGTQLEAAERLTTLWFKDAVVDEHLLQTVLGRPAGYTVVASSERYRRVLAAFYAALYGPSTTASMENFACIALGSTYAAKAGISRGFKRHADGTRTLTVEHVDGTRSTLTVGAAFEQRTPDGKAVPVFFAPEGRARVFDGDLSVVPYLVFFAEATSPDYSYAKRLDVWTAYDVVSTPDSFDAVYGLLTDTKVSFTAAEVRAGDLIKLEVVGGLAARTVYGRVLTVRGDDAITIDLALATDASSYGWGAPSGWGAVTGWGGFMPGETLDSYVVYGRRRRTVDAHLALDEMPQASEADGETIALVNARLAELLSPFMFALEIDWNASMERAVLDDLRTLLEAIKPAETGYFAYTRVNDAVGLSDRLQGQLYDRDPYLSFPLRWSYVGQDFVGSFYIAPTTTILSPDDATPDPTWFIGSGALDTGELGGETSDQTARFITVL